MKNFDKQKSIIVLLIILIVLVVGYIGRDLYLGMQQNMLYRGYEVAVQDMMNEAQNEHCAPFPVFVEDDVVYLIDVDCLEEGVDDLGGEEFIDEPIEPEMEDEFIDPEMGM